MGGRVRKRTPEEAEKLAQRTAEKSKKHFDSFYAREIGAANEHLAEKFEEYQTRLERGEISLSSPEAILHMLFVEQYQMPEKSISNLLAIADRLQKFAETRAKIQAAAMQLYRDKQLIKFVEAVGELLGTYISDPIERRSAVIELQEILKSTRMQDSLESDALVALPSKVSAVESEVDKLCAESNIKEDTDGN